MKKLLLFGLFLGILSVCNMKKEEKGELPDVDLDLTADAGELPEYEVNWAEVDVGTTTKTVEIPKVVVVMEEETLEVPFINVDMPGGDEKIEQTIMVEAEVTDTEHDLNIVGIWAVGDELYVVSTLEAMEQSIGDQKMRVSDQITLNAPDLAIKHYIVGARPDRIFNTQYDYMDTMEDLKAAIDEYTVIYTK